MFFYSYVYLTSQRVRFLNSRLDRFYRSFGQVRLTAFERSDSEQSISKKWKQAVTHTNQKDKFQRVSRTQVINKISHELSSMITEMDLSRRLISINFSTMYSGSVLSGTMYVFLILLADATDMDRAFMYAFFLFSVTFMMLPPNLFGQMLINQVSTASISKSF